MTVLSLVFMLVVIPASIGYFLYAEYLETDMHPTALAYWRQNLRQFFHRHLEPGDLLIYRKSKVSTHPGPRARNVQASEKGDDYYYEVDKYWTVAGKLDDGRLVAVTRTGKQVYLKPQDQNIRKAGPLQRLLHRRRFPSS